MIFERVTSNIPHNCTGEEAHHKLQHLVFVSSLFSMQLRRPLKMLRDKLQSTLLSLDLTITTTRAAIITAKSGFMWDDAPWERLCARPSCRFCGGIEELIWKIRDTSEERRKVREVRDVVHIFVMLLENLRRDGDTEP